MRLVSYLRPSKQAAAGEEAAAGRVSGLSACAAAGLSYFEQCPLSYARLCVDLCVQVSPQTRQIACKIFVDFCHVVLVGLKRRSAWAKRGQNLFQLRMIQRIRPSELLSVRQNPEQLHSDPCKQCRPVFAAFSANFLQSTICIFRAKVSYSLHCGVVHTRGLPKISIREKSLTIPSARAAALLHSRTLFLRPQTLCCNLLL